MAELSLKCRTTSGQVYTVEISADATVRELKELFAQQSGISVDDQKLILLGKVLKDHDTLDVYGIRTGQSLHLVKSVISNRASPAAASEKTNVFQSAAGNKPPVNEIITQSPAAIAAATANIPKLNPSNQSVRDTGSHDRFVPSPEHLHKMLNSSMFQAVIDNPIVVQEAVQRDPKLKRLLEKNPEIQHLISDPKAMAEMLEVMRNPAMYDEMIRNADRMMSHLENTPGGYNEMLRLHQEYQVPLQEAADEIAEETETSNINQDTNGLHGETSQNDMLPNPWEANSASRSAGGDSVNNPLSAMMSGLPQQQLADFQRAYSNAMQQQQQGTGNNTIDPLANYLFEHLVQAQRQNQNPSIAPEAFMLTPEIIRVLEVKYATQLKQLQEMGFPDHQSNLTALKVSKGDLGAAVEFILNNL